MRLREGLAYLVALLAMTSAIVCVASLKGGTSEVTASWVQAFGSIAAIVVVSLPVVLQQSLAKAEARKATLSTVKSAHSLMVEVTQRYVDPTHVTSEWWVPRWSIMENALSQCPIYQCGSSEGVDAFLAFREHFTRAEAINDADGDIDGSNSLGGFVGFVMMGAAHEVSRLDKALK